MTEESQAEWRRRVDRLWSSFDPDEAGPFVAAMTALAEERPDDPVALFELGGAHDSTGSTPRAVELYRRALALGLSGPERRQAVIQLASSLRAIGQPDEAVALLEPELAAEHDEFDDAVRAFLALALHDVGRAGEGLALTIDALVPHLPRYGRSLSFYARDLRTPSV
ncbi:tetratricopeptide repeat protein [Herbiconiux sp. L3-i23]|uniref:tetratricopeptide repeat protein n=1 Tax=Herbiconiux sp. L3-i23 TaxID=2905871 RepID=UPI00207134DD|nr:tetratricopeptide repeat protein [Herbiconiux sp. L3-i23]BDI23845.1 hypothetical protein L3i23_26210 [Herbiconiux sp. L3-i23]